MTDATTDAWIAESREACARVVAEGLQPWVDVARAAVVSWRWAAPGAGPHRPEPWWTELQGHEGGWLPAQPDVTGPDADRVGFDELGRPVIVEAHRAVETVVREIWEHREGSSLGLRSEVDRGGGLDVTATIVDDAWRATTAVVAEYGHFFIEDEGQITGSITRWIWEDGLAVRGTVTRVDEHGTTRGTDALNLDRRPDGTPAALRLAGRPFWLAPLQLRPTEELLPLLVDRLTNAIVEGLHATGVVEPFVLEHWPGDAFEGAHLPGFARVGGAAYRAAVAGMPGARVRDALADADESALFNLASHCDAETLGVCAELNSAFAFPRQPDEPLVDQARSLLDRVADELTRRLNAPGFVDGAAADFTAFFSGPPYSEEPGARLVRVLGAERLARFDVGASAGPASPPPGPLADEVFERRDALTAALADRGIRDAETIVANHAVYGLRLAPRTRGGSDPVPGSRLYGPGVLPAGEPWPLTEEGRPLEFLAAIDLGELPADTPDGPTPLPAGGWLLYFADLDAWPVDYEATGESPDDEGTFFGEQTFNVAGAAARVLRVPAGETPVEVDPPALRAEAFTRPERRCDAVAQLALPTDWDASSRIGLRGIETEPFGDLATELAGGPTGTYEGPNDLADWILGPIAGIQGDPPDPQTVLLLHLTSVEFQDGGTSSSASRRTPSPSAIGVRLTPWASPAEPRLSVSRGTETMGHRAQVAVGTRVPRRHCGSRSH